MIFSSIPFLYYFLPGMMLAYFLVPFRWKNFILLIFSLVFYSWGEPTYVILMIISILIGYLSGLLIEKSPSPHSKSIMILSIILVASFLIYFKYANFLIENINALCKTSLPLLNLTLPIGISFYTFQIISYLVDVDHGKVAAQKNLISFGAYISMFPQLIAGPIVRYQDIEKELNDRTFSFEKTAQGMRRFIIGLSKKVLLANSLGALCHLFLASQDRSVLYYWLYALAFSLQIYFDFSGYSDMAIGLGKILGFHFPENFNYPYLSSSIREFWKRWHISLGSWFRDYVYIPLGGNRVKKTRWFINISIVWLLTGLWHGAAWNFVVWGGMFAVLLVLEKTTVMQHLFKHKGISHLYVLVVIMISFVLFNAANLSEAWFFIQAMFGFGQIPIISKEFIYYLHSYSILLIISVISATPVMKHFIQSSQKKPSLHKIINVVEPMVLILLLLAVTSYLINDAYNPFLYFRF